MNGKGLGLLILIGIVIYVIVEIFSFIAENLLFIGIFIGIIILLFVIIKIISNKLKKKKNIVESIDKNHNDLVDRLERTKISTLNSLVAILDEIDKLELKPPNMLDENYNPLETIANFKNILKSNSIDTKEVWDIFYDNTPFGVTNPRNEFLKRIVIANTLCPLPYVDANEYLTQKSLSKSFSQQQREKVDSINHGLKNQYDAAIHLINAKTDFIRKKLTLKENEWCENYQTYSDGINTKNDKVDLLKKQYYNKERNAIESYYLKILEHVTYDPHFQKSIKIKYNDQNKILIIEYLLPSIAQLPKIKEIRYIKTRYEYKEVCFTEKELESIYDDLVYRIVLDIINLVFQYDMIDSINSVVYNGWSAAVNKATGQYNKSCILSVCCEKIDFLKIKLSDVDPKECFKSFKGISAGKLSNLTPIKPVISIEKNDSRFISSKEVEVSSSTNLATMSWEDFEHLIRELFEKEFSSNGGEVKVTQASRDGGVDAIAFDPDPIRGGKIVIQAKRYTNTVGVSAVRDLYGTVMNEGATKGILVTTADYGPDAYTFAQNKPLTLLNGSNLLYLLEKHGHKAKIDIKEAKKILKEGL
jgi:restriction system protein